MAQRAALAARKEGIDDDDLPLRPSALVDELAAHLPECGIRNGAAKRTPPHAAAHGPHPQAFNADHLRVTHDRCRRTVQDIATLVGNADMEPCDASARACSPLREPEPHAFRARPTRIEPLGAHLRGELAALAPLVTAKTREF